MRNYQEYYERMSKNVQEKIDFIIPLVKTHKFDYILDFGCADGQTTRILADLFPDIQIIGYDINTEVIRNNRKNQIEENIFYAHELDRKFITPKTLVFFSSVFHEIYSFGSATDLLNDIFVNVGAIAIRDMYFTNTRVKNSELNTEQFKEYKRTRVKISNKELAEFTLKKDYKTNWKNELEENYFATDWDEIESIAAEMGLKSFYDYKYMNQYILGNNPELIYYTLTTHRKLIMINYWLEG